MAAYNFKKQFVDPIRSGSKTQTIRPIGKRRHARPGEPVQLYVGQRTRACSKILELDPVCVQVLPVALDFRDAKSPVIVVDKRILGPRHWASFARMDGFESIDQMRLMFASLYGIVRTDMVAIRWTPPDRRRPRTKGVK